MYAGIYVRDIEIAKQWYAQLFGSGPSFVASDTEVVWELEEHRSVFIDQNADHAGHSVLTIFVDDFEDWVTRIAQRGVEPTERVTYRNGVRKALYRDPDGNEVGLGGAPVPE
nr:VOC family protein [Pelagibacterium limicola]